MSDIGDEFQQQTKYQPGRIPMDRLWLGIKPSLYKEYPKANKIELPSFEPDESINLDKVLNERKSVRDFKDEPISIEQLSYLLRASTGIQRIENGFEFRTAPSAGGLYPIETYVIANNVSELQAGIYHYCIRTHKLDQLQLGDFRDQIASAALEQRMCAAAAVAFIWSAVFDRCKWKYGQRGYRYIYLEAGHIAGNLALAAVGLNLGSCQIGALYDDQVNVILDIDGVQESVIYISAVGVPL